MSKILSVVVSIIFLFCASALAQTKPLKIVVGQDSFPYQFVNKQGEVDGLLIDLWKEWARVNQKQVEFVPTSWEQTLSFIKDNKADIHAGLVKTDAREKYIRYGQNIVDIKASLFIHRDVVGIEGVNDLIPYKIGVIKDSFHHQQLLKMDNDFYLKIVESRNELYELALEGKVKVFAGLGRIESNHAQFKQLSEQFPLYKKLDYFALPMHYGVSSKSEALFNEIYSSFENIAQFNIPLLERKWLGVNSIQDDLVLTLSIGNEPYMNATDDGQAIGLFVDIWKLWSEKTGRNVKFLSETMESSLAALKSGKADIHIAYPESERVKTNLPQGQKVYTVISRLFYPTTNGHIDDLDEIDGQTIGMFRTAPYKSSFESDYPRINVRYFDDLEEMILASQNGELFGFIAATQIGKLNLRRLNLSEKFNLLESQHFEADIYSLIGNDNQALKSQIEEGFRLITKDELAIIENRWVADDAAKYFALENQRADFTEAERLWIKQHRTIRVGVQKNWRPIEFENADGNINGITDDVLTFVRAKTGLRFEYVRFDKWQDILDALKAKEIDLVGSISVTPERRGYIQFTDAYWPTPWSVMTRLESPKVSKAGDFIGKRLAIIKGFQIIPTIMEMYPNIILQVVPDIESGVKLLIRGEVDGLVENLIVTSNYVKENRLANLKVDLLEDIESEQGRFGFRIDWPEAVPIVNKAIRLLTPTFKQNVFNNWFQIKVEQGLSEQEVQSLAYKSAMVFILVISLILLWMRSLKKEIKLRKKAEEQMKHMATHDELTGLPNRALLNDRLETAIKIHSRRNEMLAVVFLDLDGFKFVNDTYGHDVGDELLIQVATRLQGCVRKSDTIARFGGDEFVFILSNLKEKEQAQIVCEKILSTLTQPFILSKYEAVVGASMGISLYPKSGLTSIELVKTADAAMYEVKASGKNNYVFA